MSRKRRVLFVGEASFLATGFSTYWNEVISRIHRSGEFECCELGSYANEDDPRCRNVPWRFVPVQPAQSDAAAWQAFNSKVTNQFGEHKFDELCLSFKPDIVALIRDWWMDEFVLRSPLRRNFKIVWMPTVDGAPQRDPWMDSYGQCDHLLTYSQYGMDVLRNQSNGKISPVALACPGADLNVFRPVADKRLHKKMSGIDPNAIIVGTVMRNQVRKLYYDLIEAFAQWYYDSLRRTNTAAMAKRTYLYLHTSYPDVGYDIGKAIREFKVASRTLMTYICASCGSAYPAFFAGEWTSCAKCRKPTAHPPNASHSLDRPTLAQVVNLFDLYVQYSICLHPNTPIMMADGSHKPISDVSIGDVVVSFDGSHRRVKSSGQTKSRSETVEVRTYGDSTVVILTPDHECMVLGYNGGLDFVSASRLMDRWVVYPIPRRTTDPILWSDDKLFSVGAYIANGGNNSIGSLSWSFPPSKEVHASRIETWLDSEGITHSRCPHPTADEFRIIASGTEFHDEMIELCGRRANDKHVPLQLMSAPIDQQTHLIRGLFAGDGCWTGHGQCREHAFIYSTVSRLLAYQVRDLLLRQDIPCSVVIQVRTERQPRYDVRANHVKMFDILAIQRPPDLPTHQDRFLKIVGDHLCMKVRSVNPSAYTGPVFDISVEVEKGGDANSRSFVANHFVTHNCEG